jgi:hypothetical protein
MSTVDPAAFYTSIFNTEAYKNQSGYLTIDYANRTYLKLVGGSIFGSLNIGGTLNVAGTINTTGLFLNNVLVNSTATELNYLSGITLGIGTASKVLTLNSSSNVSGINKIFTKYLDIDNNDTTPFSVSGLSDNYGLHLHSQITGTGQNYGSAISFNHNATGNVVPLSAIVLDKTATSFGELVFYNRNGGANIQENFRMKSNGEFKCVSLNINNVALTASATELNYLNFSPSYVLGVNEASKALVLDASRNTSNINNISVNSLALDNSTAYRTLIDCGNVNSGTGLDRIIGVFNNGTAFTGFGVRDNLFKIQTATTNGFAFYTGSTNSSVGTERLGINGSGIVNITSTQASSSRTTGALTIAGGLGVNGNVYATRFWMPNSVFGLSHTYSTGGTAELITYNDGVNGSFIGTFTSNNFGIATGQIIRIGVDTSGNVNIVNHNASTIGLRLNNTLITATATELNYLDLTTGAGTAEASKALVLDASRNIININSITGEFLTINTSISSSNASATFKKLNLNGILTNYGVASIRGGNNNSPYWGSTDSLIWMESSHPTPIEFEINCSFLTAATSTNPARIGTNTNNDFVLFTNTTERMRISSDGNIKLNKNLMIGTSTDTASTRLISALDSTMGVGDNRFITLGRQNTSGNQAELAFNYAGDNNDDNCLVFGFFGGEKARLTKWGSFAINTTTTTYGGFRARFINLSASGNEWGGVFKNTSNSNNKTIGFYDLNNNEKGSITFGTGTTAYNTTSDYRLKKDIIPITNGLELINNLNPVKFKWKDSDIDAEGFIAHELQQYLPYCVDGEKDGYYENGTIKPQSVDYGKITTTLVSAIKELYDKIKKLENELEKYSNKNI